VSPRHKPQAPRGELAFFVSAGTILASTGAFPYKPRLPNGFLKVSVMKKGVHPNYHFVNVVMNDGSTYKTRTTWGEPDQKLQLDIDPTTHPAWTGGQQQLLDRGGRLTRFNKRFDGFVKK
jgi:large subunit ribosomal protein L31